MAIVGNVKGLPFLEEFKRRMPHMDLFDWLQLCFGFQVIIISLLPFSDCKIA